MNEAVNRIEDILVREGSPQRSSLRIVSSGTEEPSSTAGITDPAASQAFTGYKVLPVSKSAVSKPILTESHKTVNELDNSKENNVPIPNSSSFKHSIMRKVSVGGGIMKIMGKVLENQQTTLQSNQQIFQTVLEKFSIRGMMITFQ